ncbi:YraN family protein [Pseudaestuariivita rosea]|uniref:YraN family protein n=1 Tax=Pseudaestuariivita rosea TaxID=2763263 RepID=UPI001ABA79DC|nr:YraN family protein [Pseudaestuariivita rosea]
MSGETSYYAGLSAEDSVARRYQRDGYEIAARRWRGQGGEIDLIARRHGQVVFIEVKKSRSFAQASLALSERQMRRLYTAASEYLADEPRGQDTDSRFDAALVNQTGELKIIQNAFGQF